VTVAGVGNSVLWCPSDASISEGQAFDTAATVSGRSIAYYYQWPAGSSLRQHYSSYGGIQGIWGLALRNQY